MILNKDKLTIRSVPIADNGMEFKNLEYGDLQNLTETHLYDKSMPVELRFTIQYEQDIVGEISLKSLRWYNRKAEISIYLENRVRGKGLAKNALSMLMNYAFNTMNLHRIEAEVVDYNPAGKNEFENLGFKQEGVLREAKYFDGKYHDIYSYGLLKSEWQD